jgi:hypothetical protein
MTELKPTIFLYGGRHQAERKRWRRRFAKGLVIQCACRRPECLTHLGQCPVILTAATPYDLGHDDRDHSRYSGPECINCNRSAGARASNRKAPVVTAVTTRPVTARRW